MSTRQQRRAEAAHRLVTSRVGTPDWDKYRTFCMKGPTLLLQSGTMQTIAFCESRDDKGAQLWIGDVAEVMGDRQLAKTARTAPLPKYLALSRDAIEAATWLRSYAMAARAEARSEAK
ncbi:MAG: type III-B CRISPR module-associated protein Cmr5 [Myxococcales bacterium]|nr:type III-B CRISPR module-associated protein Cmr5 [Myxococcales bacterium]MCB9548977.1 type III-B CRISPR module-associated protein Cmr5 [Myxococcales bacterium]